ncbi:MAG: transporter [Candidatus Aramenus sulfurataquae]|uniref:Transporter n=1 Tax=Candidatus Aramenus sulfurataquae TaxID=1326980 RepID=W7KNK2_9CREN|nr:MAG: transporter [Candidatus Aramenus sulfurataquae]
MKNSIIGESVTRTFRGNYITSFLAYTVPTYVLVTPAFFVSSLRLPTWLSFLVVSIPFGGRIVGAIAYQRVIALLGSKLTYLASFTSLGFLALSSALTYNVILLILVRFLVGVSFGLATSLAMEQAVRSGNRLIQASTLSGWAVGWIMGALAYTSMANFYLATLSGAVTFPLSLLYRKVEAFEGTTPALKLEMPSFAAVLVFFLSFEPAFVLQLAPSLLEREGGIVWLVVGYVASIPMYFLIPALSRVFGETRALTTSAVIAAVSGATFFLTDSPLALVPFNAFGLGINSVAPRVAELYGANARNMGIALNAAAVGGVFVPVVSSIDVKVLASTITLVSMFLLLLLGVRRRRAVTITY